MTHTFKELKAVIANCSTDVIDSSAHVDLQRYRVVLFKLIDDEDLGNIKNFVACPQISEIINLQDSDGYTSLIYCMNKINKVRAEILKVLLKVPCIDVNLFTDRKCTAFKMACHRCYDRKIDIQVKRRIINIFLADNRIDINHFSSNDDGDAQFSNGVLILHTNFVEETKIAIKRGCNAKVLGNLLKYYSNDNIEMVKLLLPHQEIEDNFILQAMEKACMSGNHEIIELVLTELQRRNLDINYFGEEEATFLLCLTCAEAEIKTFKLLLAVDGIAVDTETKYGYTVIRSADEYGLTDVVKLLLQHSTKNNLWMNLKYQFK
ncbi:MAG: ankyrin repeat protein [Alphaproteobacteria bacterium]|jgi:ankyrin repeat protein